jgi:hypothetical protein
MSEDINVYIILNFCILSCGQQVDRTWLSVFYMWVEGWNNLLNEGQSRYNAIYPTHYFCFFYEPIALSSPL